MLLRRRQDEREKLRNSHKEKVSAAEAAKAEQKRAEKKEFEQRQKDRQREFGTWDAINKQSAEASERYYAKIGHAAENTEGMFHPSTNQSPGGFRDSLVMAGGFREEQGRRRRSSFNTKPSATPIKEVGEGALNAVESPN